MGRSPRSVLIGNRAIHSHLAEILELRRRCHQEDDLTTEPEYFFAAQALPNRRCAAVLIRQDQELKACVFFFEHTRYGIGLGLFRGGDYVGESLIVAPEIHSRALCAFGDPGAFETMANSWGEHQHESPGGSLC